LAISKWFLSYKFEALDPDVVGVIDQTARTINLTVPYSTDVTSLTATYELTNGATAKVGAIDQVSGVTANDFTNPVTYSVTKGQKPGLGCNRK